MQAAHKDTSTPSQARKQPTPQEKLTEIAAKIFADAREEPKRYASESLVPAGGE